MAIPNTTWCILDASVKPAMMRCQRCFHGAPVRFPVDLTAFKKVCDAFLKEHRHCEEMSLEQVRAKLKEKKNQMDATPISSPAWDAIRRVVYRLEGTIRRLEPNPNKWPR